MPILNREEDIFPTDLLENEELQADESRSWYCLYTISRREKELVRKLIGRQIACYCPIVPKRYRSPAGRLRTSFIPLFSNYVFLYADPSERMFALQSNCISKIDVVPDAQQLVEDLSGIKLAIENEIPLMPESRLEAGNRVRVRSGPFKGYEGEVIRREGRTRFLLAINFLEQGVSMELDEALLAPI